MKAETYLFGQINVNPETVIDFPDGLVAFESSKRFILIHEAEAGAPVSFTLQSLDDAELAFQIIDPASLGFNYELALTDADTAKLRLESPSDLAVMLVLYRQEDNQKGIGANFRAPLIINTKARVGLQKVMETVRPNLTLSNLSSAV